MKFGFSQFARHQINGIVNINCFDNLPNVIQQYTDWKYTCEKSEGGYDLKPLFRNTPYRNSFVPEISITISQYNGHTILHINGQPVKLVRTFMMIWFGALLVMEILILIIAAISGLDSIFPVFIPFIMCAFGYLLCKIATTLPFKRIVSAILKEFH